MMFYIQIGIFFLICLVGLAYITGGFVPRTPLDDALEKQEEQRRRDAQPAVRMDGWPEWQEIPDEEKDRFPVWVIYFLFFLGFLGAFIAIGILFW